MSMIKCPECGRNISSMAKACPECGYPLAEHPEVVEAQLREKAVPGTGAAIPVFRETPTQDTTVVPAPTANNNASSSADQPEQPNSVQQDSAVQIRPTSPYSSPSNRPRPTEHLQPREGMPAPSLFIGGIPKQKKKKKFKKGFIVTLIVLLVVGAGALAACLIINYQQSQVEEKAYALLENCTDPLVYEDFIAKYPESKYIEDVKKRYNLLSAQAEEWKKLIMHGSRQEIVDFITKNPESIYIPTAQARIDTLDWKAAQQTDSESSYQEYLSIHPEGAFADVAEREKARLVRQREEEEAERAEQARLDSIARADSARVG